VSDTETQPITANSIGATRGHTITTDDDPLLLRLRHPALNLELSFCLGCSLSQKGSEITRNGPTSS
jgi:hypothetical protein